MSAGDSATFSVVATGLEPLTYQWLHGGTRLPGATNASLTLNNVLSSDAGDYAVRVSNLGGTDLSTTATLTVSKLTPVITWATPAAIVYGTPLGAAQLSASANAPGAFVYTPAAGTVLYPGNGQTLSVAFTPANRANTTRLRYQ